MSNTYGISEWTHIEPTKPRNVIIVCTGPSLQNFDFSNLRDKGYIIAVNDAGNFVPFADAWFTLDPWGLTTTQIPKNFAGTKYAAVPSDYGTPYAASTNHQVYPDRTIKYLHRIAFEAADHEIIQKRLTWGFSERTDQIHSCNSGYGALNLAYHMQPERVFLFGLDASRGYFFNQTQNTRSLGHLPSFFRSTLPQLNKREIEIVHASPNSTIECFPKYTIAAAIKKLGK